MNMMHCRARKQALVPCTDFNSSPVPVKYPAAQAIAPRCPAWLSHVATGGAHPATGTECVRGLCARRLALARVDLQHRQAHGVEELGVELREPRRHEKGDDLVTKQAAQLRPAVRIQHCYMMVVEIAFKFCASIL